MQNHDFPEDMLPPEPTPSSPEPETSSVDFSDLGELFAQSPREDSLFDTAPDDPRDGPDFGAVPDDIRDDPDFGAVPDDIRDDPDFGAVPDEPRDCLDFDALPEGTQDDLDLSDFDIDEEPDEPREAPWERLEREKALESQEAESSHSDVDTLRSLFPEDGTEPQAPTYQAVDYPDADSSEDGTVLPGEAAWLLQKLRELPPDPQDPYTPRETPPEMPAAEEPDDYSQEPEEPDYYTESPAETVPYEPEAQELPRAFPPEALPPEMPPAGEEPLREPEPAAPQPEQTAPQRRVRKGRPKRKKGEGFFGIPNLVVTAVWIAITVLIGVTLGRMVWVCAADVLAFGREDKPVTVTVYESDTIDDITRKLHDAELIHYPGLFKLYASFAVDEGEIHPGIWDLNTRYDYHALVNMMSPSSSREVIELMIPEGYSCRQIFALMEEKKICTALDLGSYAAAGELDDYWFLDGVARGDMYCLEGFLFPDTYQFYKNDSPRAVLQKMLDNFGNRFNEEMVAQIGSLNDHLTTLMKKGGHGQEYIDSHQFDVRDVVIVASLIEKETSSAEEGYTIASVIYNRLYNWGDHPPLLNIDASIVYALGGKTNLTQEDLKVQSPYNTYLNTGLTPGPISNPGLASIQAALQPQDTNYYFYVLDPAQGSHVFTTTYEEHQTAKASVGG